LEDVDALHRLKGVGQVVLVQPDAPPLRSGQAPSDACALYVARIWTTSRAASRLLANSRHWGSLQDLFRPTVVGWKAENYAKTSGKRTLLQQPRHPAN